MSNYTIAYSYKNLFKIPFPFYFRTTTDFFALVIKQSPSLQLLTICYKPYLASQVLEVIKKKFNFNVRVLLDQQKDDMVSTWCLAAPQGFTIRDAYQPNKKISYSEDSLVIQVHQNELYINNKKILAQAVQLIADEEQPITFNSAVYPGSFFIVHDATNWYLINQVELEQYIYCVLQAESWPGWPLEVNKAFAIACRSYVLAKVLEAKNSWYHIKNTNIHQTYQGLHTSDRLQQAVVQTDGVILAHNKKPILAMFDSCCGGIIPTHIKGVDFKHAPYLARSVACTFCKPCKLYEWHFDLNCEQFEQLLQQQNKLHFPLKNIHITQQDKAGVVHEVQINSTKEQCKITGKQLYSWLTNIKSYCYKIEKKAQKIIFSGRGYGHHLGICQWGARNMVEQGWDYLRVLQFYYPNTVLMKLRSII